MYVRHKFAHHSFRKFMIERLVPELAVEVTGGVPYAYGHTWSVKLSGNGVIPSVVE